MRHPARNAVKEASVIAERLQKILAAHGLCSRRSAEALIAAGRVRVNGYPAALGQSADPAVDRIEIDGKPLPQSTAPTTLLLYKPRGYVTTLSDEQGRKTVAELLPAEPRLFPVGRLDRFSEGLLLMTNDGALANLLTHPSHSVDKVYLLWVSSFCDDAVRLLRRPIMMDGTAIRQPGVRLLQAQGDTALLEITIHEGRNRQIRRMCEAAGLTVTRLKRIREGRIELGALRPGEYRPLTPEELHYLETLT